MPPDRVEGRRDEGDVERAESRRDEGDLEREVALVELVNRVLDKGVVISGEVMISVAGVDLVQLGLSLYVASAETLRERGGQRWIDPPGDGE